MRVYCMYCNNAWDYTGSNPTNICCPKCSRRFDITKGKAKHFNSMAMRLHELEQGGKNV